MKSKFKRFLKKAWGFAKRRWYLVLIVLAIGGFLIYRQQVASAPKGTPYTVKKQTLKDEISFSGQIDADEKVALQFQTGGQLAWVGVKEGDYVKKYQAIASLDQRQLQKTMQRYLNTYVKTRLTFDQQQKDSSDVGGLSTEAQQKLQRLAEESQMDLNNSVIDVEVQNIALKYATLTTPIAGIVDRVDTPVAGVNISAVSPATFTIVNPDTLYFSANADQTDVVNLRKGEKGYLAFDSYPDDTIPTIIKSIAFSPTAGETGTVYAVKMDFMSGGKDKNSKYRLGMTGDATFITKTYPDVLSIPTAYIKAEQNKQYVLRDINGKGVKTYIKTGETVDTQTIVTSGLQAGDVIYD